MKAPEGTVSIEEARKLARRYADAEGSGWLGITRTKGERMGLADALAKYLGLPWEHRRRKYYRQTMDAALAAYDLRMESRSRSQQRRWESYRESAR